MTGSIRQSNLFAAEDYLKIYKSFKNVDFTAYDFDSIKTSLIEYLKVHYPEDFNDFIESSEYIALIEMLSFVASSLALRIDLNSRENFLDTAERRESVIRLARMLSYKPNRRIPGKGLFKVIGVETNQPIIDSKGNNLKNKTIYWNDFANSDSFEQFITILNNAFITTNPYGKPVKYGRVSNIDTALYRFNSVTPQVPTSNISLEVTQGSINWDIVNPDFVNNETFYELHPDPSNAFHIIYRDSGLGAGDKNTGFFLYLKQGTLIKEDFNIELPEKNRVLDVNATGVNNEDVYFQEINTDGSVVKKWTQVPAIAGSNVIYNPVERDVRDIYSVITEYNDKIKLKFADGDFGSIPKGLYRCWVRESVNFNYVLRPEDASNLVHTLRYTGKDGLEYTLTLYYGLQEAIKNAAPSETNEQIKLNAPATYYTQNRMVNGEDYNVFPLSEGNVVLKVKALNRTHAGHSRYIDINDPTGTIQNIKVQATDGAIYKDYEPERYREDITHLDNLTTIIRGSLESFLKSSRLQNFFYDVYYKQFKEINPGLLEYQSSGYKWATLPRREENDTGFFYNSADPNYYEEWVYDAITNTWKYSTNSYTSAQGIPLRDLLFDIEVDGSISENNIYVDNNIIRILTSWVPPATVTTNPPTIRINYRPPVNLDDSVNVYIRSLSSAIFTNTNIPDSKKIVTIKKIRNSGIPEDVNTEVGPVELSSPVEDKWVLSSIIPMYRTEFSESEVNDILLQLELQNDFGLGYDIITDTWYVIPADKLYVGFSLDNEYFVLNSKGSLQDSSWLVYVRYLSASETGADPELEIILRGRRYIFESSQEVRFYYSEPEKLYDLSTETRKRDEIVILDVNKAPVTFDNREFWAYFGGNWSYTDSAGVLHTYPNDFGIPVKVKDPSSVYVTSSNNSNDITNENINDRGVLETSAYTWNDNDNIELKYKTGNKLKNSLTWYIDRSFELEDGYTDHTKVEIVPSDFDRDGVPDDPLSFDEFVTSDDFVYLERFIDFDGYEYFVLWETGYVDIEDPADFNFLDETINGVKISDIGLLRFDTDAEIKNFIAVVEDPENFVLPSENPANVPYAEKLLRQREFARKIENLTIEHKWITKRLLKLPFIEPPQLPARPPVTYNYDRIETDLNHLKFNGRSYTLNKLEEESNFQPLLFMWKHYAPIDNRIDPSVSNIIDMYILTSSYYNEVLEWKAEEKSLLDFPVAPDTNQLTVQFGNLNKYKMLTDEIIFHSASFKVLFGKQALPEYRAMFKVVKMPSAYISDSEIKSKVINAIDEYFSIDNWNFGESFYYSELASYIHYKLSTYIASVVIVPEKQESQFGDLFQIKAEPTELFLSTATVANVEIVKSLTDENLRVK